MDHHCLAGDLKSSQMIVCGEYIFKISVLISRLPTELKLLFSKFGVKSVLFKVFANIVVSYHDSDNRFSTYRFRLYSKVFGIRVVI